MPARLLFAALLLACSTTLLAQQVEEDLTSMVVEILQDPDPEMRALALEQIRSDTPGEEATLRFTALLPELPIEGRAALLRALAERGDRAALPAVLKTLEGDEEQVVRLAAIEALGKLGGAAELPRLVDLLSSKSEPERDAARESLVRLPGGNAATESIVLMLKPQRPEVQAKLIGVLAERRGDDAVAELIRAAVAEDVLVRKAAMQALGKIGGPADIGAMVAGVLKAEGGSERVAAEKAVARVCARIDDPTHRADPLLAVVEKLDAADQRILLSTLGRVGGPAVLERVERAVASDDPAEHAAGVGALANWPDASVAPQLIRITKTGEHPAHRLTALRALIRVAPVSDGRSDAEKLALLERAMQMCTRDEERLLALNRAAAIRTVDSLRFVLPYVKQTPYAEQACLTVVELAHHRGLREANKDEFFGALDEVLASATDPVVLDRANRYKLGKTWVRPK